MAHMPARSTASVAFALPVVLLPADILPPINTATVRAI